MTKCIQIRIIAVMLQGSTSRLFDIGALLAMSSGFSSTVSKEDTVCMLKSTSGNHIHSPVHI